MNETTDSRPGMAIWVIGIIALLWNLLGLWMYYSSVTATPEMLAQIYNETQLALFEATPKWALSANAIAVTFGVIGSILLLLRNKLAVWCFGISLLAIVVQDIHFFVMTNSAEVFGSQLVYIQGVVFVVAVFLLWYSNQQKAKGVLT